MTVREGGLNFSLVCRAPNGGPKVMDKLADFIQQTERNSVILGKYNLPGIHWSEMTARQWEGQTIPTGLDG
jgi:hypothetical protein